MYETLLLRCFELQLPKNIFQNNDYVGRIVVSVICYSDETDFVNFSVDKKIYPVYITLGNIYSDIRSRLSQMSIVLLALLSVKIKLVGTTTTADEARQTFHTNQLQQVLELILRPLKLRGIHNCHLDCADRKKHGCYPIFIA